MARIKRTARPQKPPQALNSDMDFLALVSAIRQADEHCAAQAGRVVNMSLTLRNWLIGSYIYQYELNGKDRAEYGDGLLGALAARLIALKVSNCNRRQLYRYLRFFRIYPEIVGTLSPQLPLLAGLADVVSVSAPFAIQKKVGTPSAQLGASAEQLLERLSYSHLEQIVDLDEPLKRAFYEIECIRGNWSVRQLKRQIVTLYFERSGLSEDKEKVHRILKCHVLIELKVDKFRHEHIGQLNTYVTWYRAHMMAEGDNPPIGLLL